jgi:MFS family permease
MSRPTKLLLCVAGASFMVIFDGSAFQMTQPVLQRSLGGTIQEVQWSMMAFLLVSTSTLLPFGRAGDVLGRDRVYRSGIAVFVVASALCAAAPSLWWLVLARAGQGLGAAMVTANSAPILVDAFPEQGGRMLGLGNIALALGMISGPPLGAILAAAWSWRLIFLVALPIGSAVWLGAKRQLPASPRTAGTVDIASGGLSVLGLGAVLLGGTFGHRWGWTSPATGGSIAIGLTLLGLFFLAQTRAEQPILELALLRQRMFLSGLLAAFFGFGGLFAALAVLPYLLLVAQGRGLAEAGLLVGILPLVLAVTAPLAGAMTDKIGSRSICTASLAATAAAFVLLLAGCANIGAARLAGALALAGAGLGGFEAPNDVDVLRSLPPHRMGAGTAMLGAVRSLGMTFGVAAGATLLDYAMTHAVGAPPERMVVGVKWALSAGAASALVGAATAWIRPGGRARARQHPSQGSGIYSPVPNR